MCAPNSVSLVRVFLLAGNRLLREALGRILRKRSDMLVAGESFDSFGVAELIAQSETDVILMDPVSAPSLNLDFVRSMSRARPDVKILVIGMDENEAMFLKAIRAGAAGYLLKDASAMDVIAAIRAVSQGEAV